jgi:hypothetical protein
MTYDLGSRRTPACLGLLNELPPEPTNGLTNKD